VKSEGERGLFGRPGQNDTLISGCGCVGVGLCGNPHKET
jgi:hypothetical protein